MSESLDDSVENFLLGVSPCPFDILAKDGGERRKYVSIVRHELLIEVGEAREAPDVSDILRDWAVPPTWLFSRVEFVAP